MNINAPGPTWFGYLTSAVAMLVVIPAYSLTRWQFWVILFVLTNIGD